MFLGTNFMSLSTGEGEDKALTLPSNSSHPLNTRTVTKGTPHDPSLKTQPSRWSSWTFRTEGNPECCRTEAENGMWAEETTQRKQKMLSPLA